MNERELGIKSYLSKDTIALFEDMYYGRSLGAASNIEHIGKIFIDMAQTAKSRSIDGTEFVRQVVDVGDYYIEKRGDSAYVIVTAINIILKDIRDKSQAPLESTTKALIESVERYKATALEWKEQIKEYSYNIIKDMESILIYDYSSNVNAVMEVATERGKTLTVYIPESRALDGGKPFVINAKKLGHNIHFFPDSAMVPFVKRCDAAFIGAETFFPDGCCANTVGSELVATLCNIYGKPLYVPTALIKVNIRGMYGFSKQELWHDMRKKMSENWDSELADGVNFNTPDLAIVPPQDITGYITEQGVIPPAAMFGVSLKYVETLNVK